MSDERFDAECPHRLQFPLTTSRRGQAYRMDLVMAGMFAGVILDIGTTWALVAQHHGIEQNRIVLDWSFRAA